MKHSSWIVVALALSCGGLALGCRPELSSTGSLVIDGVELRPVACHVLVGATGIELEDAAHDRLRLTIPPVTLEAFKETTGAPEARFDAAGGPARSFGPCGSLLMRGEGYHGGGKRAVSGKVSLACTGATPASGELTFSGCF